MSAKTPLRVMRIITRLNVGGPSYQAIFLTQRLQDPEFTSVLLAGNVGPHEGSMEGLAAARGVEFTRVPGLGREISLKSDLPTVHRVFREMRRYRPQVVHTHLAKAGAVGRLAAKFARVPSVVHTYHGHVFHGYFSKRKSAVLIRIERALARATDRIVVLGEAQEREILNYGVGRREQMRRIPLGLELEPFLNASQHTGELRRELGIASGVPLVGIVARLVPIKAHSLFLEAAWNVGRARPDAQFLIVGDGELRTDLEAQARQLGFHVVSHDGGASTAASAGAGPTVRFLGFRNDLPRIYADLDLAVLCSLNEGLPVTIIEALAAGRPVVSTEVGSVADLVVPGHTGALVPSSSPEALSDAILAQLADPERALAMAQNGRGHVFPKLSVDRLEQDLRGLYRELAER
jgi:glycosyltransferase involved in cell wall biosynthesis